MGQLRCSGLSYSERQADDGDYWVCFLFYLLDLHCSKVDRSLVHSELLSIGHSCLFHLENGYLQLYFLDLEGSLHRH